MKKIRSSVIGHGDVKIGEYQNSNIFSSTAPQSSLFSHLNINDGGSWNIPPLNVVIVFLPRP